MTEQPDTSWITEHIKLVEGFPRLEWKALDEFIVKNYPKAKRKDIWHLLLTTWLNRVGEKLGPNYQCHESNHFIVLTSETTDYCDVFLNFLEKSLKRIRLDFKKESEEEAQEEDAADDVFAKFIINVETTVKKLFMDIPEAPLSERYGKQVVIIIDDPERYYPYVSYFYPEDGEYGFSAGMFVNKGYGHIILMHDELTRIETVAAHELTHEFLNIFPLPVWLEEGLCMTMENVLTYGYEFRMDTDMHFRHREYWNEENIQEFWEGTSFSRSDEAQELSYHLAQFLIKVLGRDTFKLRDYINKAHFSDGGETAAIAIYSQSLGQLLSPILGDGSFKPEPTKWKEESES